MEPQGHQDAPCSVRAAQRRPLLLGVSLLSLRPRLCVKALDPAPMQAHV